MLKLCECTNTPTKCIVIRVYSRKGRTAAKLGT